MMTDMMPGGIEVTNVYEMAGQDNLLNFASFNCEHADEVRLPFLRIYLKGLISYLYKNMAYSSQNYHGSKRLVTT